MGKYFFTFIAYILFNSICYSQAIVSGWDLSKWGMTPKQVSAIYPGCKTISKDDDSNLFVVEKDSLRAKVSTTYKLGKFDFEVLFIFNKNKLELVTLNYVGSEKKQFVFEDVSKLLIEKYGQPSVKEDTNLEFLNLKLGNIKLSYLSFSEVIPLIISYEKKKANKL